MAVKSITTIQRFIGLSSDSKPTACPAGSTFHEYDTKSTYITYDGGTSWVAYANTLANLNAVKEQTISGAASQNLFQVTGVVRVNYIFGIVTTQLAADVTAAYLEVDDGAAQTVLTLVAGAPDISAAPVGSYIVKSSLATAVLQYISSATANVSEVVRMTTFSKFVVVQKTGGVATYIRLAYSGAGATGVIYWRCNWEPMSTDSNLVAV